MVAIRDDAAGRRLTSYVARMALLSLCSRRRCVSSRSRLFMDEQLALRRRTKKGCARWSSSRPFSSTSMQDFVQNDPFLREPVIFMASRGFRRDSSYVIQRRFPGARLTYVGPDGSVWRLD